ncbi:hypothetical protein E2C01_080811 [Portunus trituberculatus]|uniref:SCAN box domain-containing protein n=1 Tax=Portunus trituberculatus TaxID=210409 RepID=A0A5B7IV01_PORTR|nr:hypothetical protein [Portunus trituberculatus]
MHLTTQGKPDTVTILNVAACPTLPVYQEGEDIATYLTRFERVAELLQLEPSTYATTKDCDTLKKSLLTGFKKTADGYHLDFRNAKIRDGENYSQFSVHLARLFQSWLETSQVQESFHSLKKFMILDQFLALLNPDLCIFIKEHRPNSAAS